ncbi:MAG: ubiquinol-cytochrome c reductase iron-sulfur subunit [Rhodocyclaceae bacterium]|nr:ubiquinol-cytochrome c reductase iron-sulfur subunit [Rhodocyclaceae bacterium]
MAEYILDQLDKRRRDLIVATSAAGGIAVAASAVPFAASMTPSEQAKATGAPVTTDLSRLAPGEMMTLAWRGKPVWILHRTPQMLDGLTKVESQLLDPASTHLQQPAYCRNAMRSRKPEYLVAVGLCTHLGCIPTFRPEIAPSDLGADWQGGYFCPCHGSRFDLAGRVYRNVPAPLNLEIPPYFYSGNQIVIVGLDEAEA